jgi:hypothetical protein
MRLMSRHPRLPSMPAQSQLIDEIRDMLLDCGLFDSLSPNELLSAAGYFNISKCAPEASILYVHHPRWGSLGTQDQFQR